MDRLKQMIERRDRAAARISRLNGERMVTRPPATPAASEAS
jgi:hypothetical protein